LVEKIFECDINVRVAILLQFPEKVEQKIPLSLSRTQQFLNPEMTRLQGRLMHYGQVHNHEIYSTSLFKLPQVE